MPGSLLVPAVRVRFGCWPCCIGTPGCSNNTLEARGSIDSRRRTADGVPHFLLNTAMR